MYKTPKEILDKIGELGAKGYSSKEIGAIVGKKAKVVQELALRHNLPRLKQGAQPGPRNHFWIRGYTIDQDGYKLVKADYHPFANNGGYVREHRLVVEKHLKRYLLPVEVVHHKDGNKLNNSLENLEVFRNNAEHLKIELKGKIPKWSEDGIRRIQEGCRRPKRKKVFSIPQQ